MIVKPCSLMQLMKLNLDIIMLVLLNLLCNWLYSCCLATKQGKENMVILMLLFWDSTYNLCNTSKLNYKCWRAVQISLHQGLGSSSLPTSVFTLWFSLGCRIFSEKCGSFDTSSFIFVLLMRLIVGLFLGTTMRRCYRSKYFW